LFRASMKLSPSTSSLSIFRQEFLSLAPTERFVSFDFPSKQQILINFALGSKKNDSFRSHCSSSTLSARRSSLYRECTVFIHIFTYLNENQLFYLVR